jgi:hypothetical protein
MNTEHLDRAQDHAIRALLFLRRARGLSAAEAFDESRTAEDHLLLAADASREAVKASVGALFALTQKRRRVA